MEKEKRIFTLRRAEVREHDGSPMIEGYAAVFNSRSHFLWGFFEEIASGAFSDTLATDPDVRATIEHNGGLATIGRTRNGTLVLREDDRGLRVQITPPDTQAGRDALTLVRGGYVDQMSFMFNAEDEEWDSTPEGAPLRRLTRVSLDDGDVALVTYPAYPQTSAEVRSQATRQRGTLMEKRGRQLAALLNNLIADLVDDETGETDIVAQLADAAGITVDTVNQILSGETNCPPQARLEAFATALNVSVEDLIEAAANDGCEYDEESERSAPGQEADCGCRASGEVGQEARLRLMRLELAEVEL